ncbi:hypothetical protein [Halapricum hydrolyticum]|uniref:Uncharacterized protein n=1 Tax=Halapricum hydrolyticum TaxID=2979991 RepID=A0AAE3IAB1_9EURY|nr:hypothetical protein [Halapricum hydrolyticum]MCU4718192.1 hypothetical protein [Halapricum hydrolyticum]MCU4726367.1 hypothetical protein [Halapricum hydrolyticum]
MKTNSNLTRRKLLAGLGAVGVSTAGGLAIATEPARALDHTATDGDGLVLDWAATRNGNDDPGSVTDTGSAFRYSVSNLLPGDAGTLTVEMSLTDGTPDSIPRLAFDLTGTEENDLTDPEREAGDDTPNEGELQNYLDVTLFYDTGTLGVDVWGATNGEQDLGEGLIDPDAEGTLAEVAEALPDRGEEGVLLDANPTTSETEPLTDENSVTISFGWVFAGPPEINVTQTDSVSFDLRFYAAEVE